MNTTNDIEQGDVTCTIELSRATVDAGATLMLSGAIECDPPCDLEGETLFLRDAEGRVVATAVLGPYDGEGANHFSGLEVAAPAAIGPHVWQAVFPAFEAEGLPFSEGTADVAFEVTPHRTMISVWGAPSAIVSGEPFGLKVGIRCSCGCSMAGRAFSIFDDTGAIAASGALGDDLWPQSAALYHASVTIPGREAQGPHTWRLHFPAADLETPHADGEARFSLNFVGLPEHTVTVEAVDAGSDRPLAGAHVTMHPYHAITGEDGIARLNVRKGSYTLFVKARKYTTSSAPVEVAEDFRTRAGLVPEPIRERM